MPDSHSLLMILEARRALDRFRLTQSSAAEMTELKAQTKKAISQSRELLARVDARLRSPYAE